ncbi:MAG: MgtC/SapB family protein [Terriglobales bacterium]
MEGVRFDWQSLDSPNKTRRDYRLVTTVFVFSFLYRLLAAVLLGAIVGLERQWRQRMAGTRTNALVAAGAAAFVMAGSLLVDDPSARGRIASYAVSGVGFLGAGVIFRDGANVRGLNTAATIWCSASIGVLAGLGAPQLSLVLACVVLLANVALRPLAHRLHPILPDAAAQERSYEINLTCRASDESHLRALLLTTIAQFKVALQSIHSEDIEEGDRNRIRAEIVTAGLHNEIVEQMVTRVSYEPGVSAVSWSVVPVNLE